MPRLRYVFRLPSKLRRRARRSRLATMILLLTISFTLITPFYIIYKPPQILIHYFQRRWPDVLWQVPVSEKIIALTLDDGPSEFTNEITELLKANEATATFFIIGSQVSGREDILQNLIRNGNELGNHAMHDEPSRSLPNSILAEQVQSVEEMIRTAYSVVGKAFPHRYFRPGSGFFSERLRNVMAKMGYRVVLGSIYPHDPQIPFWRVNARHILSMLRPGGIIVCHDRRSWTVPMLRKVIPEIRRRGYRIVTVTELLRHERA